MNNRIEKLTSETVSLMKLSKELTSDRVENGLLLSMFEVSDIDNLVNYSEEEAIKYFLTIYSYSLGNKGVLDLTITAEKLNALIRCWNSMLGIELLRRKQMLRAEPYKIFDFDGLLENPVTLEIPKEIVQSYLN